MVVAWWGAAESGSSKGNGKRGNNELAAGGWTEGEREKEEELDWFGVQSH